MVPHFRKLIIFGSGAAVVAGLLTLVTPAAPPAAAAPTAADRHAFSESSSGRGPWQPGEPIRPTVAPEILRAASRPLAAGRVVQEIEPARVCGLDNRTTTAQTVTGLGAAVTSIRGSLSSGTTATVPISPTAIPDGSIPTARDTGIRPGVPAVTTTGSVGEATEAPNGDFDFYRIAARAGDTVTIRVTPESDSLDPAVVLYDSAGRMVAQNDERINEIDPVLVQPITHTGPYYVSVSGSGSELADPFDPSSGSGVTATGPYRITMISAPADVDTYRVHLDRHQVLGAALTGVGDRLAILGRDGAILQASGGNGSVLYPSTSPLPHGRITTDHVASSTGWYYVAVTGQSGTYQLQLGVDDPASVRKGRTQTFFLDFDGAKVDPAIFSSSGLPVPDPPGPRDFAALQSFLPAWGLGANAAEPLERAIRSTVLRNLKAAGPGIAVDVVGSEDSADLFGKPDVSRVVVGGTIDTSGLPTIGIAQSIDPGNLATAETAVVLLDVLSAPPSQAFSANAYLQPGSDRIAFLGEVLGAYISHEIGHLVGNWHTDPAPGLNSVQGLMDATTNIAAIIAGPDGVGGTRDDRTISFVSGNRYVGIEGMTGAEDTRARVSAGLETR